MRGCGRLAYGETVHLQEDSTVAIQLSGADPFDRRYRLTPPVSGGRSAEASEGGEAVAGARDASADGPWHSPAGGATAAAGGSPDASRS